MECVFPMTYRRAALALMLVAGVGCGACWAVGVYVRNTAGSTLRRAATLVQREQSAETRATLKWLLWFDPANSAANHLAGMSYLQEQNLSAAIASLERVGQDSRGHADAQISLAGALIADRQLEPAETVLSRHLIQSPGSLLAARMLSGLLLTELRPRAAIQVLEEFLSRAQLRPLSAADQLLILRDLATAEFHPPAPEQCEATLREALDRVPNQARVRLALGQCLWKAGNPSAAEPLLREAHKQRPEDLQMLFVLCEFFLDTQPVDTAEACLRMRVLPDAPFPKPRGNVPQDDDRYWSLNSRVNEQAKDYDAALQDIEHALALRPNDKEYETRRGRLLQRLNRPDESELAYIKSHELARAELDLWNLTRDVGVRSPSVVECQRVAQLYEQLGRTIPAQAWRRLASEIAPEAPLNPAR